jgi:hypothetical protein
MTVRNEVIHSADINDSTYCSESADSNDGTDWSDSADSNDGTYWSDSAEIGRASCRGGVFQPV